MGSRTGRLVALVAGAGAGAVGILLLAAFLPLLWGWHAVTVVSGSMAPLVRPGDVVVLGDPPAHPVPGALLTYRDGERLLTHRLVRTLADGRYELQGDANPTPDAAPVPPAHVVGQVRLLVPWLGLPVLAPGGPLPFVVLGAAAGWALHRTGRHPDTLARHRLPGPPVRSALLRPVSAGMAACLALVAGATGATTQSGFTGTRATASVVGARGNFAFSRAVIDSAPVGYWPLDESTGTVARDVVGSVPLTYAAGTGQGVAGAVRNDPDPAVRLTSASHGAASASNPTVLDASGPVSIMAFVRVSSTATQPGNARVASKYAGSGVVNYLLAYNGLATNQMRFVVDLSPSGRVTATANVLHDDTWHLLVGTWDGTTARLYVDGVLGTPVTVAAAPLATTTSPFYVGLPGASIIGDIDDVAVWKRALTAGEVAALWSTATS